MDLDPRQRALLDSDAVQASLAELSAQTGRSARDVRAEAEQALLEVWSSHTPVADRIWQRFIRFLTQSYRVQIGAGGFERLHALDREHSLVFLFSHRSYMDTMLLNTVVRQNGITGPHNLAGANLGFWPVGPVVSRAGVLFVRRESSDAPVYRTILRAYMQHLLRERENLCWAIEGGRTRTGKLRPPRYGALSYVVDALRDSGGPEAFVVPVSVVYDQLPEVAEMASESRGEAKRPEDLRWLARFTAQQVRRGGHVQISFGGPMPLQERITALDQADPSRAGTVERIAIEVCHRINRVTPATPTAVVAFALLGEGHALALPEVKESLKPILAYLEAQPQLPTDLVGSRRGLEGDWVQGTLDSLVESGVVERFDGGEEPVYQIAADQHLVAAFYRNTVIHFMVTRAIGELTMYLVREHLGDLRMEIWNEAMRIRDLLKFEFFFSRRSTFAAELDTELGLIDPGWEGREVAAPVVTSQRVELWFERSRPHLAHQILRPFFDAYLVVAHELAQCAPDTPIDEAALLERSLGLGQQWVLQKKLHSAESVTLELFKNAMKLARHRGLLVPSDDLVERRMAFLHEIHRVVDGLKGLARQRTGVAS